MASPPPIPGPDWSAIGGWIAEAVDFSGDLTTTLLGIATLVAFVKYRGKVAAVVRLLRLNHVNDRVAEIRKTLDLILSADIPKGRAAELRGLFGRLNGQLVPFCALMPELESLQKQINTIAHESGQLNEPIKQQIVHQIVAQIESSRLMSMNEIVGSKP